MTEGGCTRLTADNWRSASRTALLHARTQPVSAEDINVQLGEVFSTGPLANRELRIPEGVLRAQDGPAHMSRAEQERDFEFVINAEGHGGWAERFYTLLLSSQLVLAQDLLHRLWYEALLIVNVTHLVLDANFDVTNLSHTVRRARDMAKQQPERMARMVAAANEAMDTATSVAGIQFYIAELLRGYAALLRYPVERDRRAILLSCRRDSKEHCAEPSSGERQAVHGVRCAYHAPDGSGRMFDTLHEAAQLLPATRGVAGASSGDREDATEPRARGEASVEAAAGERRAAQAASDARMDDEECRKRCLDSSPGSPT